MTLDLSSLSPEEIDQLLQVTRGQTAEAPSSLQFHSLEDLLISPDGFGLETATPLQRNICRAIQGLRVNPRSAHVLEAFGGTLPEPGIIPRDFLLLASTRSAKSMIAAALAIWSSQAADLNGLSAGEIPRAVIVSLTKDNAKVVMQHVVGALRKPAFRAIRISKKEVKSDWADIIEESGTDLAGSEFVRHPSGRPVEIRVVAGKRAGGSAISRWLVCMVLDEAARMLGQDDSVINYDDMHDAVLTRIRPGGLILSISSPWQPYGPIFKAVNTHWGKPSKNIIVVKAKGPWMNPGHFTGPFCSELKASHPDVYKTDVEAEFADAASSMFTQDLITAATRKEPLIIPYEEGHSYAAKIDPATRRNAWTLVVADKVRRLVRGRACNVYRVVRADQWQGSSSTPLSPRDILSQISGILAGYRLNHCLTDQWSSDALVDIALQVGLYLHLQRWTEQEKVRAYLNLENAMKDGQIEIPADTVLQSDLRLTMKIPTQHGISIRLTETDDGRHCDYSPAVAGVFNEWIDEDKPLAPRPSEPGYEDYLDAQLEERERGKYINGANQSWYLPEEDDEDGQRIWT